MLIKSSYRYKLVSVLLVWFCLVGVSFSADRQELSFVTKEGVEPNVWVESNVIVVPGDPAASVRVSIQAGEYQVNGGAWTKAGATLKGGDKVAVRVQSSGRPDDISPCFLGLGDRSLTFQSRTKSFSIPDKVGEARNINLGISGPTQDAIGGPSPVWLKYNRGTGGSVVQKGLIPDIKPLFNAQIRDVVVCVGGDGKYYLTGSTGNDIWNFNDGVELWRSDDLKKWEYMGLVWTFEKDATWETWRYHNRPVRALWAPEIHYVKGNFYITLSMPPGDRGILKSASGKPEGPYVNALANDARLEGDIDASLFEDDNGIVYLVYGGGFIAQMKDDMSGLAEEPVKPVLLDPDMDTNHHASTCPPRRNCQDIGREGAFMFKRNGLYYLTAADTYEGRYSSMVAVSDRIYGPYKWRHEAVPCGGGTSYFKDNTGQWWCTFFGNDDQSPFREMPAMVKVDFTPEGRIFVKK